MAEAAGLAFGVISFSIQACEHLIRYIDGVKHGKSKAGSLLDEVGGLAIQLGNLQSTIAQLDPTLQSHSVREAAKHCMDAIAVLQNRLEMPATQGSGPASLQSGLGKAARRLLYPFKESNLVCLREAVSNTLQSLNLGLHALTIDQHRLGLAHVIHNTQDGFQNMAHLIAQNHSTTQKQLLCQEALVQSNIGAVGQQISSLHSDLRSLRIAIDPVLLSPSQPDVMLCILTRMTELEAKLDTGTDTYVPTGSSPAGTTISYPLTFSTSLPKLHGWRCAPQRQSDQCTCPGRFEMITYVQRPLLIWRSRRFPHAKSCRKYAGVAPDTETSMEVSWGSRALGVGFRFGLTVLQEAGFISVLPSITTYNVVQVTSPAFQIIEGIRSSIVSRSEIDWTLAGQSLKELYDTRAASPHDRLYDGMTALHYLCEAMSYLRYQDLKVEPFLRIVCPYFNKELRERDDYALALTTC